MSTRTPTPWKIVFSHNGSNDVGITADGMDNVLAEVFAEAWAKGDIRPHEARANAAFIVEACNNYDRIANLEQINAALLAVLQRFATWDFGADGYCFCKYPPKLLEAAHSTKCNAARAAIALANRDQPYCGECNRPAANCDCGEF